MVFETYPGPWPELVDLPLLPLRLNAVATDPLRLPENAGSTLRGAFGNALRRLVCVHPDRSACSGCPQETDCPYPPVFAPRAAPDQAHTQGFEDLPRPYVLRGPFADARMERGQPFALEVTLIGAAIASLPYVVLAWREMGRAGVGPGRGRFTLAEAQALDGAGRVRRTLYDGATGRLTSTEESLLSLADEFAHGSGNVPEDDESVVQSSAQEEESVTLRFVTPTALKYQRRMSPRPEFHILWRNLMRRLSLLRLAHGAGRPEMDYAEAIRLAEAVTLERWDSREREWSRYSAKQDRRVPMNGFVGVARYTGDLAPFLPALRLGAWIGVGDNCAFGMGSYQVSRDEWSDEPR